jgi:polyisoprenoid-binding protein YceI
MNHLTIRKAVSVLSFASLAVVGLAATSQDTKPAAAQAAGQATAQATAPAVEVFKVDDVHSSTMFRVQHMKAGQFWGRFKDVSGTFSIADDASKLAFAIEVAVDSVDSGEPKLDAHLKSPDFFNAKEFPKMSFKSTGGKKLANGTYEVTGDFTMHGVTKPITAAIEITGKADMGMGLRAGAEATFTVKRSEFGMNYGVEKGMVGDSVKVIVNLEGTKAG